MDQICPKKAFPVKNGRSEHHHSILHIGIRLSTKFQHKLTILIFLDQIFPKRVFPLWNRKSEHRHWILHAWISLGAKFQLKMTILNFWTRFPQQICRVFIWYMLHWLHEQQIKYFHRKSENFGNITFLPIIYKSVTENPKSLIEPEKCEWRRKATHGFRVSVPVCKMHGYYWVTQKFRATFHSYPSNKSALM